MHLQEIIWIVTGFVLVLAELYINSFIIVFFGTSAILTGILLWLGVLPATHGIPLFFFIALTLLKIGFLRRYMRDIFHGRLAENEQDVDDDFIGKTGIVIADFDKQPDSSGFYHGRVEFRGTYWAATTSTPLAKNSRVIIDRREGSTLFVQQS